jgi:hypothetical protein
VHEHQGGHLCNMIFIVVVGSGVLLKSIAGDHFCCGPTMLKQDHCGNW